MWQLTPEDETFLTENATATLSQFEKVTANQGEHKDDFTTKLILSQIFLLTSFCFFFPGSEDKIMALASSGVKTKS